jgi:hypothetical protein
VDLLVLGGQFRLELLTWSNKTSNVENFGVGIIVPIMTW